MYVCTACFVSQSTLHLVQFKTMFFAQPTRDVNKNADSHTAHISEAHAHTGAPACTWPSRCCRWGTRVSLAPRLVCRPAWRADAAACRAGGEGCWGWGRHHEAVGLSSGTVKGARRLCLQGWGARHLRKPGSDRGSGRCLIYSQCLPEVHEATTNSLPLGGLFGYKMSQSSSSRESD